jgi:carboxyl-terminal processing protease
MLKERKDLLKHLLLIGIIVPASLAGYHVMAGGGATESGFTPSAFGVELHEFSIGGGYSLRSLPLLERDLYRIESRYVDKDRLDPKAMFDGALDRVQRQFPEVLFIQPEGSDNLHVSVGTFSTVLRIGPVGGFDALYEQLLRVSAILDEHLSEDVERKEVEYGLVNGMLDTLDPHTVLLPPAAARDMEVDNKGEFGGLGIEISLVEGQLVVKVPLEDTPAFRAGLQPDDRIVRIEGESTINIDLDDAVSKLRGKVGDPVVIMVMRKGWAAPRKFTIVREKIRINPLEGELLEGDVGYIRIKSFNARAAQDLETTLTRFRRETSGSLRGLVLDLRMNPGGFLNQAIDVADKFLSDGVIVATEEGATGERAEQRATRAGTEPEYPIVVLVNASSASASEIVAGAIRNQDRGVVIGDRTFGKGSIQHLYPHRDDESRLKLTVGRYLTPGDKSIQAIGVTPDIRLVPSIVDEPSTLEEPDTWGLPPLPQISLYWRDWVDREDSLDHSFQKVTVNVEDPVYELRYHYVIDEERIGRGVDPQKDWEVQFAREVLLAAPGARRADMLRAASRVIRRFEEQQSLALQEAFGAVGLDWSEGVNPSDVQISASLDLGDDGKIIAGEHENIGLTLTNQGTEPIYRISAVTKSENPWFDRQEFYFGLIPPGESRTYQQRMVLHDGYPTAVSNVKILIQDPDHDELVTQEVRVATEGRELPVLSYTVKLIDGGSHGRGNGDGRPVAGEQISMEVSVTNTGAGATRDGFVRGKNRSGRALDLEVGGFAIGQWETRAGEPCEMLSAGCSAVLRPGETHIGYIEFDLIDVPESGQWDIDLMLGDNRAYDFTVVREGGFYDYFQQEDQLVLKAGVPFEALSRKPPLIDITRKPDTVTSKGYAVISGVVRTDGPVRDVIVYHGEDKVFYEGGSGDGGLKPFTVERKLEPGPHSFYMLVRDEQGLTGTASVHVWSEEG